MKKLLLALLSLLLCAAMLVCFAACDSNSKRANDDEDEDEESVSDDVKDGEDNGEEEGVTDGDGEKDSATSDTQAAATISEKAAEQVIEWYFDAMGFYEYDAFSNLVPAETLRYMQGEYHWSLEEFVEDISEGAEIPEDAKIEFEIADKRALTSDEMDALKDDMEDCALDPDKISRGTLFTVTVTATANGETNESTHELKLFAYNESDGAYQIFESELIKNIVAYIEKNVE